MNTMARTKTALTWILMTMFAASATSCAVKIIKVDQQTVMEEEAAGEWPEFEKEIIHRTQASAPAPFPTVAASSRKTRLFNVLNGEMAAQEKSGEKPGDAKSESQTGKAVAR